MSVEAASPIKIEYQMPYADVARSRLKKYGSIIIEDILGSYDNFKHFGLIPVGTNVHYLGEGEEVRDQQKTGLYFIYDPQNYMVDVHEDSNLRVLFKKAEQLEEQGWGTVWCGKRRVRTAEGFVTMHRLTVFKNLPIQ